MNSFKKIERLTSRIVINEIFEKGKTIKSFPFIVRYLPVGFSDNAQLKIVISVPKRRIKNAVSRNRIRRQIKEAWRLNRNPLKEELKAQEKTLALFFVYTGKENPNYRFIEAKIKLLLNELSTTLKREND